MGYVYNPLVLEGIDQASGSVDLSAQMLSDGSNSALSLGNASAPALKFTGDPNTGIYSPGADQVAISTSGVGRVFVDANGNLGVGTAAPVDFGPGYHTLELKGTTGGGVLRSSGNSATVDLYAESGAGGLGILRTATNHPLALQTNSSEKIRIASDGNVGIGTSAPQATLEVAGTTRIGAANIATVFPSSSAGGGSQFSWNRSNGSAETNICNLYDNAPLSFEFSQKTGASTANVLYEMASTSHNWRINNTERARIDSSGRLLVGTITDSGGALFQVNGDRIRVATSKTPASATAAGAAGEICWDANYIYVCIAANTWKRTAIATW